MGQQPRPLDPSGSPKALFGFHVRRLREISRLSQAQLGAKLHVAGETVGTWEKGRSLPDAKVAQQLDTQLDGHGLLLAAWSLAASHHGARQKKQDPLTSPDIGEPSPWGEDYPYGGPFDDAAREALRLSDWAESLDTGNAAIEELRIRTRQLAHACLCRSPISAFADARALGRELFALVRAHREPSQARRLYRLIGAMCVIQAWLAGDLDAPDVAELYIHSATAFAAHAGDPELDAWIASARCKAAYHSGDYAGAARCARGVPVCAASGTAAVMLACQEADAWARLGVARAARDALRRASLLSERVTGADAIGGLLGCPQVRRANYAAQICLRLGDLDAALREIQCALRAARHEPAAGACVISHARLTHVLICLQQRDLDRAGLAAGPLLSLPPDQRMATLIARVRTLLDVLDGPAFRADARAASLREAFAGFCDPAPGCVSAALPQQAAATSAS
ncbi:helix-turn-helix transcriptional regulator [Actinocrinis puniceicyclus]|uniref:Helix-turn-helix transcriptional regulator n=1 Tax=Actinocrinis puniceicyclus TaxID=977794 RepID=A0A8J7WTR2_9ACTN|nr:helix-turn-helix transcriptional regulator [Actinocrinis puniceicyclus]MBS2965550.1 helix-turn-helix transcriptional regulator [Actinocrinis puniceicyclus]